MSDGRVENDGRQEHSIDEAQREKTDDQSTSERVQERRQTTPT